jgi:hypothetical protein
MNLLRKIFGRKDQKPSGPIWWNTKQNYSLESSISGCLYSDTQDGAEKIIDEYLELRGIGSEIIRIDEF